MMRPTGEASKPVLAISIAVCFGASLSANHYRPCTAASQSVSAPGFRGDAPVTGRFRNRKL